MTELVPGPFVTPLIGAAAGIIGAWARDGFITWRRRARLRIVAAISYQDAEKFQVWQIQVRNVGLSTARACTAQLTIMPFAHSEITGQGVQGPLETIGAALTDVPTSWARGGQQVEIAIHPKQSARFEVCRAYSPIPINRMTVVIPTEQGYAHPRVMFAGRGFTFRATVTSDNAQPVECSGRAEWQPFGLGMHIDAHPSVWRALRPRLARYKRMK